MYLKASLETVAWWAACLSNSLNTWMRGCRFMSFYNFRDPKNFKPVLFRMDPFILDIGTVFGNCKKISFTVPVDNLSLLKEQSMELFCTIKARVSLNCIQNIHAPSKKEILINLPALQYTQSRIHREITFWIYLLFHI